MEALQALVELGKGEDDAAQSDEEDGLELGGVIFEEKRWTLFMLWKICLRTPSPKFNFKCCFLI